MESCPESLTPQGDDSQSSQPSAMPRRQFARIGAGAVVGATSMFLSPAARADVGADYKSKILNRIREEVHKNPSAAALTFVQGGYGMYITGG